MKISSFPAGADSAGFSPAFAGILPVDIKKRNAVSHFATSTLEIFFAVARGHGRRPQKTSAHSISDCGFRIFRFFFSIRIPQSTIRNSGGPDPPYFLDPRLPAD
jgi:hypothetical protein